jgi:hypothetical protein
MQRSTRRGCLPRTHAGVAHARRGSGRGAWNGSRMGELSPTGVALARRGPRWLSGLVDQSGPLALLVANSRRLESSASTRRPRCGVAACLAGFGVVLPPSAPHASARTRGDARRTHSSPQRAAQDSRDDRRSYARPALTGLNCTHLSGVDRHLEHHSTTRSGPPRRGMTVTGRTLRKCAQWSQTLSVIPIGHHPSLGGRRHAP